MNREMFHVKRLFVFYLALVLLAGCAPAPARAPSVLEHTFFAMDTIMKVSLYEGGHPGLLDEAEDRVKELESLLSVTDPNSEIYALDHEGEAPLSTDTAELLNGALSMCGRTGGALDISIYPVLRTWGFTTGEYAVPSEETIAALLPLVDYTQVELNGSTASLPDGMEIDLGSVAKGYTGEDLAGLLRENGVTSALLDLGGNIQAVGAKPDGSPWRVGIRDPEGGVRYWHILDPKTGTPAHSGLVSVTVVGDSGTICDGLSTALFVMGLDKALDHWRQYQDFEAILVSEDGSVTITPGLQSNFALTQTNRTLTVAQP